MARRATVLYRDREGRGWRFRAGQRVPAGLMRDELWQSERIMRHRMEAQEIENRKAAMSDVQARARMRRAAQGTTTRGEGPA